MPSYIVSQVFRTAAPSAGRRQPRVGDESQPLHIAERAERKSFRRECRHDEPDGLRGVTAVGARDSRDGRRG